MILYDKSRFRSCLKISKPLFFLVVYFFSYLHLLVAQDPVSKTKNIIVYGSTVETDLTTLPSSTSVLSQQQIEQNGADHLQNQIGVLPNVNYAGGTGRPRYFQIRGIGELEQYEGAPNSSIAVIVDDVDLTGSSAALKLFDVKQVEVHRGPQAIRFGSSALAGAINVTTNPAGQIPSGQLQFGTGNDRLLTGGLAYGGGLTEQLSWRISGFGHRQNGFRDNTFLNADDTNQRKEYSGHTQFLLEPSDSTKLKLSLAKTKLDNGYDVFTIFNGFNTQSDKPGQDQENLSFAALTGEHKINQATKLTSVTSIYESKNEYSFDGDWGSNSFWAPFDPYDFFSDSNRKRVAWAQQLRLNRDWQFYGQKAGALLGLYYQGLSEDTKIFEYSDNLIFDQLSSDYKADTYAAFASLELPISRNVKFINGIRIEQRNSTYTDSKAADFNPSDFMYGFNSTVQYQPKNSGLVYATVARGFKGGGFNNSTGISDDRKEYDSESLINLELGKRFSAFNNMLTGHIAVFYNYRIDQQIKLAEQNDPQDPLSFTYITDNAAKGESSGLELDMTYQASDKLSFRNTSGLLRSKIESTEAVLSNLKGRDQSHAPSWQYLLESKYKFTDKFSGLIGVTGRAAFYFDDSHDQRSSDYHLLHANLQYDESDWSIQLWGRNLANEEYPVRGFYFGNEPPNFPNKEYIHLGDPRSFGLTFNYYF